MYNKGPKTAMSGASISMATVADYFEENVEENLLKLAQGGQVLDEEGR